MSPSTIVEIDGQRFLVNGRPTYEGRSFEGCPVEGLLFNVRAVQATFDDENYPATSIYQTDVGARSFVYPDGRWDPERNLNEFIAALPEWRAMGIKGVTLCFQGGRPCEDAWRLAPWYNRFHAYNNVAFSPSGELKEAYRSRMERAVAALDAQGMVAIVGLFYFGQDYLLQDEGAVVRAVDEATQALLAGGHRNIILDIANEVDPRHYEHEVLRPERVHEMVDRARQTTLNGRRLLVSTSFTSGCQPNEAVTRLSDVVLPHGNGRTPEGHARIVDTIRNLEAYRARPQPIVFNEAGIDVACLDASFRSYASWGYYDHGKNNYRDGFQSPPVNWGISTPAKQAFFERVREITQGR